MKHLKRLVSIWGLCFLLSLSTNAFFDKDVHRLTMQDGLADNTVSYIYKDKGGFMWFGTNNGLSRYDGKTIKNFSLGDNYMNVRYITEISEGCLGIISGGVLSVFDKRSECFIPIAVPMETKKMEFYGLLPIDDTSFWSFEGNKLSLYRWEKRYGEEGKLETINLYVEKVYADLVSETEWFSAFCYSPDRKSLNLVSNKGSLVLFSPLHPTKSQKIKLDGFPVLNVSSVLNSAGFIWVSTIAHGIIRYHLASGHVDRITFGGKGKENMLSHTDVFQIVSMNRNRYLAVTWGGYTLLIPDKEHKEELTTEIYNNTASQMYRNLETRMLSAYYDPNGVLWIGTSGGGVIYSDLRSQFFNQYHQDRHNEICGVAMDKEKHLWLATFHQGIMKSDEAFDPMKRPAFKTVGLESVQSRSTVLCLLNDQESSLWFGNKDGTITQYNQKTKQFVVCPLMAGGKQNRASVWALYLDSRKRLWVGTDNGLYQFNPLSGESRKIRNTSDFYIRAITSSKDGTIWLGTSNVGICRLIETKDGRFEIKNGYEKKANIEANSVRTLLGSSDGNLYVGYTEGFAVLSPKTNRICDFYTTHDGLCSNFIGCITEDGKGRIWLGSNSGVSRYSRHQHLFYNYYIAGSNRSSLFGDGYLFFGNNKSLTWFNPRDVESYHVNDKVLITALEVNNQSVTIGGDVNGQTILTKGITYIDSLVLVNANRDFALTFNNLSYSEEQQKYNYRLLPYQEHWLVANDGEKASYTNLPEGEYTFEVKSIYPDGREGAVTSLKIKILAHWSRTWPFRLLMLAALSGVVFYLVHLIKKRQRRLEHDMQMKHELLTLNLEREKERQIRVERENFFTSAAHELRTPLTLILSPLQEILQHTERTEPLYGKLVTMYKNGSSLHTLVDHLLYVQKIEAGMVKLHLSEVNVVELVRDISDSFNQVAELKSFCFDVNLPDTPLVLWMDAEKISSAIKNILSNAFKYTSSGGKVLLVVGREVKDGKGFCRISVSDTGVGINEDLQERIFDSFITGDANPGFSTKIGIGLRIVKNTMDLHHGLVTLDSAPGEGSVFTLFIPQGKDHFVEDTYEMVEPSSIANSFSNHVLLNQPVVSEVSAGQETKKSLLIVEDNLDVRQYIRSLFTHQYVVLEANDGEEGVRIAMEKLPDLIISDVMMPVKDGFTCCREIRNNQETSHIPILMLTAKAEDADVLQGSRSGADDYMMKPFNPELLKVKVGNLILQRERLKRIYTKALMLKQESADGEKEDLFMRQVINIVEANLSDESFNVKALADQLNMSQPTLYRKLKQHSKLAAVDVIRSIRISKAASLVMENRYTVQEVSEMVGYSDVRTLRKHFTEQFGVPPSKYGFGESFSS